MTHNLDATVFVFRSRADGAIRCEYMEGAKALWGATEWEHLATVEPRLWIAAHWAEAASKSEAESLAEGA
jgi:hypothetical protein